MVVPFEFPDAIASSVRAGKSDSLQDRFSPRVAKDGPISPRQSTDHIFREEHFGFMRKRIDVAAGGCGNNRVADRGVGVAEQMRPISPGQINQEVAVYVLQF